MSRKLLLVLSLLVSLSCPLCVRLDKATVKASDGYRVHNLNTGLNYTTIQEAMEAPETLDGHTLLVDAGVYYQNLVVNKSLTLVGGGGNETIIDGAGMTSTITVLSDNVTVTGFTIRNSGPAPNSGIVLQNASDCSVSWNTITNNGHGIEVDSSSNHSRISWNNIEANNGTGISLMSPDNVVDGNNVTGNEYGISLISSSTNVLRNSSMTKNRFNFDVEGGNLADFMNDVDASNTVDGKPVCYWVNETMRTVPLDAGYVALVNCTGIRVEDLSLTNNGEGVLFAFTENSTIVGSSMTDNLAGIILDYSSGNNISANNVTRDDHGIVFRYSDYNSIEGNNVTNNLAGIQFVYSSSNLVLKNSMIANYFHGTADAGYGVELVWSPSNGILGNDIVRNQYGIWFRGISNSSVYHNNFVNNTLQVKSALLSVSAWDNGVEGNYWTNYKGTDVNHDGIGDTSLVIDSNNTDNYPLMGMFSDFDFDWHETAYEVCIVSSSTVSSCVIRSYGTVVYPESGATDGNPEDSVSFKAVGSNGTSGFCRVMIPATLLNGSFAVYVDEVNTTYSVLPCSNDTCKYLYFTYQHLTHEVTIIPEFSSLLILPLFMLATIFTTRIYRRKHTF